MNSNNYKAILGENLSDKITIVKEKKMKAFIIVYKGTLSPFQSNLRFIFESP